MPQLLPIYLRTYRKRGCLTQGELGFLLGSRSGTKISRYERLARTPTLKTAFGLQVVFNAPADVLFCGLFAEVEQSVIERTQLLLETLEEKDSDPLTRRKLMLLRAVIAAEEAGTHSSYDSDAQ